MAKTKTQTIRCPMCGNERGLKNYYKSSSPLYAKNYGYIVFCKECVLSTYDTYFNIIDDIKKAVIITCMKFDIPFSNGDFQGMQRQLVNDPAAHPMKIYMQKVNSLGSVNNDKFKGFDPNFLWVGKQKEESIVKDALEKEAKNLIDTEFELTEDIILYWGKGRDSWEYEFLENQMFLLKTDFECNDYGMEMIMKDICFTNLDIERIRQGLDSGNITKLIDSRSKLMNDGNLKPVQSTGADKNEKLSLGVFIKKWENERPIKKQIDDEMKRYIDTFMIGHLAKMEGLDNEAVRKYEEAIKEYTIDIDSLRGYGEDE